MQKTTRKTIQQSVLVTAVAAVAAVASRHSAPIEREGNESGALRARWRLQRWWPQGEMANRKGKFRPQFPSLRSSDPSQ